MSLSTAVTRCDVIISNHHIRLLDTGYLAIVASAVHNSVPFSAQLPVTVWKWIISFHCSPAVSVHIHTATMGNIHTCGPNECVVISGKNIVLLVSLLHLAPCSTCFVHFTSHMAFLVTFDNNMICSGSDSYFYHLSDKYLFKLIKNKWNRSHWLRSLLISKSFQYCVVI